MDHMKFIFVIFQIYEGKETHFETLSPFLCVLFFLISIRILDLNWIFKNPYDLIYYIMQYQTANWFFSGLLTTLNFFFLSNESKCKVKMEEKQDNFSWGLCASKKKWGKPEMWFMPCTRYWYESGSLHPLVTGILVPLLIIGELIWWAFMGSILWRAECSNMHHPDNHAPHRLLIHPFRQIMHISPFLAHIDSVH